MAFSKFYSLIPAFFLLCSAQLIAQNDFTFSIGPQLSDLNFKKDILNNTSTKSLFLGISADARLVFFPENKLQIELGFGFSQKGEVVKLDVDNFQWGSQWDPNLGFDPSINSGENIDSYIIKNHNSFLELPVQANYFLQTAAKGFFVFASLRPGYLISSINLSISTKDGEEEKVRLNNANSSNDYILTGRAGLGYEIPMIGIKGLHFSTYFDQQLTNSGKIAAEYFPFGFGILAGIRI